MCCDIIDRIGIGTTIRFGIARLVLSHTNHISAYVYVHMEYTIVDLIYDSAALAQ